jgi:oligopeptide transport system permease protein
MDSFAADDFEPIEISLHRAEEIRRPSLSYWQDAWIRFRKNRAAVIGLYLLGSMLLMALLGPHLNGHTYYETNLALKNQAPSIEFWFGTDDLGRDMFTRIWYGARISLLVGISAAVIDLILGVIYGGIAGYVGGKTDEVMMRCADLLYGLPYLLVVILLMVVMGPGLLPILIAMSITGWINMARIVRGQIYQLKELEYIMAARALGASHTRILFRHLVPNAVGPIIITMTLTIPTAIFIEAFLSFLGLGVQAPIASWGTMASDGLPAMTYFPWRLFLPALFISLTMLGFNMVGDGMRDALDPRLRK